MQHYPVNKQFCLALCTVKCGLVSERVTRANSNFLINEMLNFGTAIIFQNFHVFIQKNCPGTCIFLFLLQFIHPSQLLQENLQSLCNPNALCYTQFRACFFTQFRACFFTQFRACFLCTKTIVLWI